MDEGVVGVLNDEYDLCLSLRPHNLRGLEFVSISQRPFTMVMSKDNDLAYKEHLELKDFGNEKFLLVAIPSAALKTSIDCCMVCDFYPQIYAEYPTVEQALFAAEKNYGVMVGASLTYISEDRNLIQRPISTLPPFEYGFVVKAERLNDVRIQAVIQTVKEYCVAHPV